MKCYKHLHKYNTVNSNSNSFQFIKFYLFVSLTFRRKQRKNVFPLSLLLFCIFIFIIFEQITAFCSVLNSQIWTRKNLSAQKCAWKYNKSHVLSFIYCVVELYQAPSTMHIIGLDGIDMLKAYTFNNNLVFYDGRLCYNFEFSSYYNGQPISVIHFNGILSCT